MSFCLKGPSTVYTRLYARLAYKSEVLSEANFGEFIDVTPISRYQFLPDKIMDRFPFYAITPCISRISISIRNVQKIECIEVKR